LNLRSRHQSRNFNIAFFDRLNFGGVWLGNLDINVQNYRHTISAFGGFDTAEFDIVATQTVLNDWILNGLFRPVIVTDDSLSVVWEGFVDSITINQGGLNVTQGPVTSIANRVFAIYSGVDVSVYPPVIGVRKKTPTVNSLDSQATWGIWPEIISLAGVSDSNADLLVSMWLQEHKDFDKDSNFSFNQGGLSITVKCSGWYQTLKYPYNYILNTGGTIDLSERLKAIITAQPNSGWISTDYSRITPNTVPAVKYVNDDRLAIEYIRGLTAMGDASNNRYYFGIYEGRQAVYEAVSTQIDYYAQLSDPQQQILDPTGAVVPAWRVRPGKWVFFNDFIPGLGAPFADLRTDPRALLIETIQFDVRQPFAAQFSGGKNSRYEQKSAKLGLRGTAV
jgi:hypothetical protein